MERRDARARILGALRATKIEAPPLPAHEGPWTTPSDLVAAFRVAVERAGAQCIETTENAVAAALAPTIERLAPHRIVSTVPGMTVAIGRPVEELGRHALGGGAPSAVEPRRHAGVDLAIVAAEFGVAENGAVWITDRDVPERALWFLCEHLVVVLGRDAIVPHLHAAYDRLGGLDASFGLFLSGPSKTADIEQSLVIGAHGPRSTTILVVS